MTYCRLEEAQADISHSGAALAMAMLTPTRRCVYLFPLPEPAPACLVAVN